MVVRNPLQVGGAVLITPVKEVGALTFVALSRHVPTECRHGSNEPPRYFGALDPKNARE